jgi:hypothetical protein
VVCTRSRAVWRPLCLVIFLIAPLFHVGTKAQTSKECELLQQRISGSGNVNTLCLNLYQECASQAAKKLDFRDAQNQCLRSLGDCQMAGQLSGEDLQRIKNYYEKSCKN